MVKNVLGEVVHEESAFVRCRCSALTQQEFVVRRQLFEFVGIEFFDRRSTASQHIPDEARNSQQQEDKCETDEDDRPEWKEA